MCNCRQVNAALVSEQEKWVVRARALLSAGGAKAAEVDALIASGQQFLWGELDSTDVADAVAELRAARTWLAQVMAKAKGKPPIADIEVCCRSCSWHCFGIWDLR